MLFFRIILLSPFRYSGKKWDNLSLLTVTVQLASFWILISNIQRYDICIQPTAHLFTITLVNNITLFINYYFYIYHYYNYIDYTRIYHFTLFLYIFLKDCRQSKNETNQFTSNTWTYTLTV